MEMQLICSDFMFLRCCPGQPRWASTRKTVADSFPVFVDIIQCSELMTFIYYSPSIASSLFSFQIWQSYHSLSPGFLWPSCKSYTCFSADYL